MSACAERWEDEVPEEASAAAGAPSAPGGRGVAPEVAMTPLQGSIGALDSHGDDRSGGWNVLATELVSYPPISKRIWLEPGFAPTGRTEEAGPAEEGGSQRYAAAWLEDELDRLAARRRTGLASTAVGTPVHDDRGRVDRSVTTRRLLCDAGQSAPRPARVVAPAAGRPNNSPSRRLATGTHAAPTRASAAAIEPRGLRRLLPGAATLALLAAAWFGIGAVASAAHHVQPQRLRGSVRVHGGLAYVVQPGDTLWSIASRVEPGADPRPLVGQLQAQLHGRVLLPGDRLLLPG